MVGEAKVTRLDVSGEMRTVIADLKIENTNLMIENTQLKAEKKRISLLHEQLEYKVGRHINIENELDVAMVDLHEADNKIKALEKELEVYKRLELSQKANETAKWIIESGQSLKRPRVDQ